MQLEVLYSTDVLVFYNIVQRFEDINIQLGLIYDRVQNEIKSDRVTSSKDGSDTMKNNTDLNNAENINEDIVTPAKPDFTCWYDMYTRSVQFTEEELRDQIGRLMKSDVSQAREYNELLNKSRKLNKIIPKQMPECLYITKDRKYDEKVTELMKQLLWEDGCLTITEVGSK